VNIETETVNTLEPKNISRSKDYLKKPPNQPGEEINKLKLYHYFFIFFVYFLAAVAFTYPLIKHISESVSPDLGDPLFMSWLISWNQHWLLSANHSLSALYNTNIFYPYLRTLAFSDLMLVPSLATLPLRLFTTNPLIIANLTLMSLMAFTGLAMFLLIRHLTGSSLIALLIGLFYAFSPYHLSQVGHIQLQTDGLLIMALLFLHKYLDDKLPGFLFISGLFIALQALTAWYYAVYAALIFGLFVVYFAVSGLIKLNKKFIFSLSVTIFFSAAIMLPFTLPYLHLHNTLPNFVRNIGETRVYSAVPLDYLLTVKQSRLWGQVVGLGVDSIETVLFPGLAIVILALASLVGIKSDFFKRQRAARIKVFYLLAAIMGFIMSLGPYRRVFGHIIPLPFGVAFSTLPAFKIMRVPARFGIFVLLGLSVMAAYGLKWLFQLWSDKRLFGAGADLALMLGFILIVAQTLSGPIAISKPISSGTRIPPMYKWLAKQDRYNAIIEVPLATSSDVKYEYFSSYHKKNLVNGYSGYAPPTWGKLNMDLEHFPDARSLEAIYKSGADGLIVHTNDMDGWNKQWLNKVKLKFRPIKRANGDYFFEINRAP